MGVFSENKSILKKHFGKFIWILLLWFSHDLNAQTIIPGGYVSGYWDSAGSPYLVDGNLLVQPDSTLETGPGTQILFRGDFRLEIHGQLLVNGTPTQPVLFDGEDESVTWRGIYFNNTDTSITDSSILVFGTISNCLGGSGLTLVNSGRVRVSDFTISHCSTFQGGAIRCAGSNPLFVNLLVENNTALDGAGIALDGSNAILRNCMIRNNSADGAGGGIVIFDGSFPVLEYCEFSANTAYGSGGGIYINGSGPVFRRCSIIANTGAIFGSELYSGGGVSVKLGSNPIFENCIFENNISHREGGGIASFSENKIINCLFRGNTAEVKGGGAFLSSGNLIASNLNNCTFSGNESPQGSALAARNHKAVLRNCILWHSNPSNPESIIFLDAISSNYILDAYFNDIRSGEEGIQLAGGADYLWGVGNIDLDPQFLPGTCDLSWQSPCIEAGTLDTNGLYLPGLDLSGNPRFVNERIDMGSMEYQSVLSVQSSMFKVQSGVSLYPNPAKNWIFIDIGNETKYVHFQIFNRNGVLLKENSFESGNQYRINTSDFPAGIYILKINSENEVITRKFTVLN